MNQDNELATLNNTPLRLKISHHPEPDRGRYRSRSRLMVLDGLKWFALKKWISR